MTQAALFHLVRHDLTRRLVKEGITRAQFLSVQFKKHPGDRFSQWRIVVSDWPQTLFVELRTWCTLRWLLLESDSAEPGDRDEAWMHLSLFEEAEPLMKFARERIESRERGLRQALKTHATTRATNLERDQRIYDDSRRNKQIAEDYSLSVDSIERIKKRPRREH